MGSHSTGDASLQQRTLNEYLALCANGVYWTRRLAMLTASAEAAPFALAVLAAGGTVLWVCRDEADLRQSSLTGLSDFQVTTLSEALRILKNEIRKGLPVSVGVLDVTGDVWPEAVHRGVQPDAVLALGRDAGPARTLAERGAQQLCPLEAYAAEVHLAQSWRQRRDGDAAALAAAEMLHEPQRTLAMRWLRSAPRLFPRDLSRWAAAAWQLHPNRADAGDSAG